MDSVLFEPTYGFHVKDLPHSNSLKSSADEIVRDIKRFSKQATDVHIHIEPEVKDKHIYSVTLSVHGLGETVVVKKSGKDLLSLVKKVKRATMRQLHRLSDKTVSFRRHKTPHHEIAS